MTARSPILVCGAVPEEVRPLAARLEASRDLGGGWREGWISEVRVVVGATGDGATHATASLRERVRSAPPRAVLGIGFAGGLDPGLAPGQIVVAGSVEGPEGRRLEASAAWSRDVARTLGAPRGLLLSSRGLVPDPAAKMALHEARGPALTVDLESASWAAAADEANLPWLVVRLVFDTAAEAIPGFILDAADPEGRVDRRRIALGALRHPTRIPHLKRLGEAAARHAATLADAVPRVLSSFGG